LLKEVAGKDRLKEVSRETVEFPARANKDRLDGLTGEGSDGIDIGVMGVMGVMGVFGVVGDIGVMGVIGDSIGAKEYVVAIESCDISLIHLMLRPFANAASASSKKLR